MSGPNKHRSCRTPLNGIYQNTPLQGLKREMLCISLNLLGKSDQK